MLRSLAVPLRPLMDVRLTTTLVLMAMRPGGDRDRAPRTLPGDWTCGECGASPNFARRTECFRCGAPRPEDGGGSSEWAAAAGERERPAEPEFRAQFERTRVFVENLPPDVDWQRLKDHFLDENYPVVYASVSTDASGRSKGHGIVQARARPLSVRARGPRRGPWLTRFEEAPWARAGCARVLHGARVAPSGHRGHYVGTRTNVLPLSRARPPSARFAWAQFETVHAAQHAIDHMKGSTLDGADLNVRPDYQETRRRQPNAAGSEAWPRPGAMGERRRGGGEEPRDGAGGRPGGVPGGASARDRRADPPPREAWMSREWSRVEGSSDAEADVDTDEVLTLLAARDDARGAPEMRDRGRCVARPGSRRLHRQPPRALTHAPTSTRLMPERNLLRGTCWEEPAGRCLGGDWEVTGR